MNANGKAKKRAYKRLIENKNSLACLFSQC
jgi:hypothetical protein